MDYSWKSKDVNSILWTFPWSVNPECEHEVGPRKDQSGGGVAHPEDQIQVTALPIVCLSLTLSIPRFYSDGTPPSLPVRTEAILSSLPKLPSVGPCSGSSEVCSEYQPLLCQQPPQISPNHLPGQSVWLSTCNVLLATRSTTPRYIEPLPQWTDYTSMRIYPTLHMQQYKRISTSPMSPPSDPVLCPHLQFVPASQHLNTKRVVEFPGLSL